MGIRQKLMVLSVLAGIIILLISVLGYHSLNADLRIPYVLLTLFGLLVVALIFSLCTRFAADTMKSMEAIERQAREIAGGNLALEDLEVTSHDGIGSLTESFNTMRQDLRALVQKLLDASNDVAKSSKDLTKYVGLAAQAAEQISGLAGRVSHDMVRQLEDVETMAANVDTAFSGMDDLSTKATGLEESVSASAEAVALLQQDTQTVIASMADGGAGNPEADQGADVVEQCFSGLLEELSDIKQQARELHGLSQSVADKTGYIIDTVGSIDQLSRKTAQSAETIEASTEEEEFSILEIVAAAQSLEDLAMDMHEAVARFRL